MDKQEIKKELQSIEEDLRSIISFDKKATFQLDPVKHGIQDLEDKSKRIAALLNEVLEQTAELRRNLAHFNEPSAIIRWQGDRFAPAIRFVPQLMESSETSVLDIISFSKNLKDIATTLEKEAKEVQMQRSLRTVPVPQDAPERPGLLQKATDLLGRIIPSFN